MPERDPGREAKKAALGQGADPVRARRFELRAPVDYALPHRRSFMTRAGNRAIQIGETVGVERKTGGGHEDSTR